MAGRRGGGLMNHSTESSGEMWVERVNYQSDKGEEMAGRGGGVLMNHSTESRGEMVG